MPWIFNPLVGILEQAPTSVQLLSRYVSQTAHGFTALKAVVYNGTAWVSADSSVAANLAQGIVLYTMTNSFVLGIAGKAVVPAHGLTAGVTYYTTDTPGVIGTTHGTVTQAVLFVEDANTLQLLPMSNTVQAAGFTSLSIKVLSLATTTTLSCVGSGFTAANKIYIDGVQQTTTLSSSTELQCPITLDTNLHTISISSSSVTQYFRVWTTSTTYNPGTSVTVTYAELGGGGGGGAGGEGTNGTIDASAGGGGGYATLQTGTVALTAQSYVVTIATAAAGGAQQASQHTDGADGTDGGTTSAFGITAPGGGGGKGGKANSNSGGGLGGTTGGGQGGSLAGTPGQVAGVNGNDATSSPGGAAGVNEGGGGGGGRQANFLGPACQGGQGANVANGGIGQDGTDTPPYVFGGGGPGGGSASATGSHSGKGATGGPGIVYIYSTVAFA